MCKPQTHNLNKNFVCAKILCSKYQQKAKSIDIHITIWILHVIEHPAENDIKFEIHNYANVKYLRKHKMED